jgi:hypothetical protein
VQGSALRELEPMITTIGEQIIDAELMWLDKLLEENK